MASALRWGGLGGAGGLNPAAGVAAAEFDADTVAGEPWTGAEPGAAERRGGAGAREWGDGAGGGGGKRCVTSSTVASTAAARATLARSGADGRCEGRLEPAGRCVAEGRCTGARGVTLGRWGGTRRCGGADLSGGADRCGANERDGGAGAGRCGTAGRRGTVRSSPSPGGRFLAMTLESSSVALARSDRDPSIRRQNQLRLSRLPEPCRSSVTP